MVDEKPHCSVCGKEITKDECENFDGMCWECWDDQLTEESDTILGSADVKEKSFCGTDGVRFLRKMGFEPPIR